MVNHSVEIFYQRMIDRTSTSSLSQSTVAIHRRNKGEEGRSDNVRMQAHTVSRRLVRMRNLHITHGLLRRITHFWVNVVLRVLRHGEFRTQCLVQRRGERG